MRGALAVSLLIHGLVLLIPRSDPASGNPPPRLEARFAPPPQVQPKAVPEPLPEQVVPASKSPLRPRIMTTNRPGTRSVAASPKWSVAERQEMNHFLDELSGQARAQPTLAQRSLAMAREVGRQMASQEASEAATLELRPNAPPADPFSLEMYVDALVKRLNRSAAFVKNDPRSKGVRTASIQFRLNPDGSLKSFSVINAGDQAEEIAFIQSVVERSIPFSPFPPDINRSARSLAMKICILPGGAGGGFGFTRMADGRGC